MDCSRVGLKHYGASLVFDPREGETVIAPAGPGTGNWAGAPSVLYDGEAGRFYLSYRVRRPRPIRGGVAHIAQSDDGISFETVWTVTKEDLGTSSMERFALTKDPNGRWLLYLSYVDPSGSRWCIDVVAADKPSQFDVSERQPLLRADQVGVEGVKDPWVMVLGGTYYMLVSYAARVDVARSDLDRRHATADIYNTGLTLSCTGLALSHDGLHYEWAGDVLMPREGAWDAYASRLGCLVPTDYGWFGYYDGAASVEGNYEERTGLVHGGDLRTFHRLSLDGPSLVSPVGSGGLRYADVLFCDGETRVYYECCREDGSHELRMNRL